MSSSRSASTTFGPRGGSGTANRSARRATGPAGGSRGYAGGSGSFTTQRGSTINYGAAGRGGTTPGGVNYGRGVGGVQVTTPGGRTATQVGRAGGVAGPGGNVIGGRSNITTASGPRGTAASASRGRVAVGPQGAAAASGRVGTATGARGTYTGASRSAAALGPYGGAAARGGFAVGPGGVAVGGSRAVAGRAGYGTYYASRGTLATTGGAVRSNFRYYNTFTPNWYARYPGAWFAAGWTANRIWAAPVWGSVATFCNYPVTPIYYDYGETVVYSGDTVIMNGQSEIPATEYAQQATSLAEAGQMANVEPQEDQFTALGVFAMVSEGETRSTNIFQLAVSKDGVIRGNYYNALTETNDPVHGSVDKKTQRAAWTVGDRKRPVYEAGIANLTKDETTMLVHFADDNSQQFTLIRIQQPDEGDSTQTK